MASKGRTAAATDPHSQPRDAAASQQRSQGATHASATHASADPRSVDVDPTSGALRPMGGSAPPRPPPTNTPGMRNMLTDTHDTHDTQDDEDEHATESPKHDEHENSGDPARSLNAASTEEISPHPAETEDVVAPARGNYLIPGISFCDFLYLSMCLHAQQTLLFWDLFGRILA